MAMLQEMQNELEWAREKWLAAKKAYEDWRDGYMPYFEDPKEYEERLEHLMLVMDSTEDFYQQVRLDYDKALKEEYDFPHDDEEEHDDNAVGSKTLKDLYDRAVEARKEYDRFATGEVDYKGGAEELRKELDRMRKRMNDALDDYDEEYRRLTIKKSNN
jgi:soluble cytochrome b562